MQYIVAQYYTYRIVKWLQYSLTLFCSVFKRGIYLRIHHSTCFLETRQHRLVEKIIHCRRERYTNCIGHNFADGIKHTLKIYIAMTLSSLSDATQKIKTLAKLEKRTLSLTILAMLSRITSSATVSFCKQHGDIKVSLLCIISNALGEKFCNLSYLCHHCVQLILQWSDYLLNT